jgi:hypothetical protein
VIFPDVIPPTATFVGTQTINGLVTAQWDFFDPDFGSAISVFIKSVLALAAKHVFCPSP